MYLIPEMIDLGLADGQSWPSVAHRVVAQNLVIGNSRITTRDDLREVCQKIMLVPSERIELATYDEMRNRYSVPLI